jgi:hypothetical protein
MACVYENLIVTENPKARGQGACRQAALAATRVPDQEQGFSVSLNGRARQKH